MNEQQDVTAFDLERMFIGDLSLVFLLEIAFRTAFIFVWTVALVRGLGKRGMRQLTPLELVIIIALGSAVGDPMFYPDVPLIHGMTVVAVIVLLEIALGRATGRHERFERLIESGPTLVVRDGRVDLEALRNESVGCDELFSALREAGFDNLGDVRLAYLESSGNVSTFRAVEGGPPAGLSLLPEHLADGVPGSASDWCACRRCGWLSNSNGEGASCETCESAEMVPAAERKQRISEPAA